MKFIRFLAKNKSTILSLMACAGVVATGYAAVKAVPKAEELRHEAENNSDEDLTKMEIVKAEAKAWLPVVALELGTISCIVLSHKIDSNTIRNLIGASGVGIASLKKYKDKIREVYGEDGLNHVIDEVAKDDFAKMDNPEPLKDNEVWYYDEYSGRYMKCTEADMAVGMYKFQRNYAIRGYTSISDFYEMIQMPDTDDVKNSYFDNEFWDANAILEWGYESPWIDIGFAERNIGEGITCYSIYFITPTISPDDFALNEYY